MRIHSNGYAGGDEEWKMAWTRMDSVLESLSLLLILRSYFLTHGTSVVIESIRKDGTIFWFLREI